MGRPPILASPITSGEGGTLTSSLSAEYVALPASLPISLNDFLSAISSMRSRMVRQPRALWRATASSPPRSSANLRRRLSSSTSFFHDMLRLLRCVLAGFDGFLSGGCAQHDFRFFQIRYLVCSQASQLAQYALAVRANAPARMTKLARRAR